jgi:serine acetyltransferase
MTPLPRSVELPVEVDADADPDRPVPFWASVRQDLVAHVPPSRRGQSRRRWVLTTAGIALCSSGFHVTLLYRLSHLVHRRLGRAGRVLAGLLSWGIRHLYGCSIAPTARLHGGMILPHPQGIVIGADVRVGPRAWIYQNVTLGGAPGKAGVPRVGADARIFCGAVLSGPITVGDHVMVGANAVVHRDVPDRTWVRCPPAEFSPLPVRFSGEPESHLRSP